MVALLKPCPIHIPSGRVPKLVIHWLHARVRCSSFCLYLLWQKVFLMTSMRQIFSRIQVRQQYICDKNERKTQQELIYSWWQQTWNSFLWDYNVQHSGLVPLFVLQIQKSFHNHHQDSLPNSDNYNLHNHHDRCNHWSKRNRLELPSRRMKHCIKRTIKKPHVSSAMSC